MHIDNKSLLWGLAGGVVGGALTDDWTGALVGGLSGLTLGELAYKGDNAFRTPEQNRFWNDDCYCSGDYCWGGNNRLWDDCGFDLGRTNNLYRDAYRTGYYEGAHDMRDAMLYGQYHNCWGQDSWGTGHSDYEWLAYADSLGYGDYFG